MPADGTKNLDPVKTKEEARRRGHNGGIKSGQARRKKKTIRETTEHILNEYVTDPKQLAAIEKAGLPVGEHPIYKDFVVASIILRTAQKGRTGDLLQLMEILGEDIDNSDIEDSDAYFAAADLNDSKEE